MAFPADISSVGREVVYRQILLPVLVNWPRSCYPPFPLRAATTRLEITSDTAFIEVFVP